MIKKIIASIVAAVFAVGLFAPVVSADSLPTFINPSGEIQGTGGVDNIFYAYVNTGERLSWSLPRFDRWASTVSMDWTVNIKGPTATESQTCTVSGSLTVGSVCAGTSAPASADGIWEISWARVSTGSQLVTSQQWGSPVNWGGNQPPQWFIKVLNAGNIEQTGRVFAEKIHLYQFYQMINADMRFWYVDTLGYVYDVHYPAIFGAGWEISADAFGIVKDGQCESAYRSAFALKTGPSNEQNEDIGFELSPASCGGRYRIFLSRPDTTMPRTARDFATGQDTWLNPGEPKATVIDSFKFISNGDKNLPYAGTYQFDIKNYIGNIFIRISNGTDTVRIQHAISGDDTVLIDFDGKDNAGKAMTGYRYIVRVDAGHKGEIHFVGDDIEGRIGGIIVNRITGSDVQRTALSWNDSYLKERCNTTWPSLIGNLVDSTPGVHGWDYTPNANGCGPQNSFATTSWGDQRYIDDWAYDVGSAVSKEFTGLLAGDILPPDAGLVAAASGVGAVAFGLVAVGLMRRRAMSKR